MWIKHAPHMKGSCQTYERVMSHMWMSHVPYVNESCHTHDRRFGDFDFDGLVERSYKWVMSHTWSGHVAHANVVERSYEWVMSHTWTSHVTHVNKLCYTHGSLYGDIDSDGLVKDIWMSYEYDYSWIWLFVMHTINSHVVSWTHERLNSMSHTKFIWIGLFTWIWIYSHMNMTIYEYD